MTRVTGAWLSATPETVTVRIDEDVRRNLPQDATTVVRTIPRDALSRWDTSRGRRSRGQGAKRGFFIGLAVGVVGGAIAGAAAGSDPPGFVSFTGEQKSLLVGSGLGVVGAAAGAALGALAPGEKWQRGEPVRRVQVSLSLPPRGVGGSLALSF